MDAKGGTVPSKRAFLSGFVLKKLLALQVVGAVLLLAWPAYAELEEPVAANSGDPNIVSFVQQSVNDATSDVIGAVSSTNWLDTAASYSTVTAPASWSTYRFTHWSNDSYPIDP